MKDLLKERSAAGLTVFMSTHTLPLAEEIADRIGVIRRGELQFVGTVEELKRAQNRHEASLEGLFLDLTNEDASAV